MSLRTGGMEALVNEPASVEWLRSQLPHGWMIISPELVNAMRRLVQAYRCDQGDPPYVDDPYDNDETLAGWYSDTAAVESALQGGPNE